MSQKFIRLSGRVLVARGPRLRPEALPTGNDGDAYLIHDWTPPSPRHRVWNTITPPTGASGGHRRLNHPRSIPEGYDLTEHIHEVSTYDFYAEKGNRHLPRAPHGTTLDSLRLGRWKVLLSMGARYHDVEGFGKLDFGDGQEEMAKQLRVKHTLEDRQGDVVPFVRGRFLFR